MASLPGVSTAEDGSGSSIEQARAQLIDRLRSHTTEIGETIFDRLEALPGDRPDEDREYIEGLRAAISAGLEYALAGLERGDSEPAPIPPAPAAAQARLAARHGVSLDTVLRRYTAADRVLAEFIMDESDGLPEPQVRRVLRTQGHMLDHLMATMAAEYTRELERIGRTGQQILTELVQQLLDGAPVTSEELGYELGGWHLAAIVGGAGAEEALRDRLAPLSCQLLCVARTEGTLWAWLGSRQQRLLDGIERKLCEEPPSNVTLALGEPRSGVNGWRLSHHEARAAETAMAHAGSRFARGRDSVLLAAVLRDPYIAESLRQTYIAPLDEAGSDGQTARRTLRAYLDANGNAAAAASALGVNRHTVKRRLGRIEEQLGLLLPECHPELEVALALDRHRDT